MLHRRRIFGEPRPDQSRADQMHALWNLLPAILAGYFDDTMTGGIPGLIEQITTAVFFLIIHLRIDAQFMKFERGTAEGKHYLYSGTELHMDPAKRSWAESPDQHHIMILGMPGRPELYCTEQLDHITQQQSAMFEAQRNATRTAITEIDMYDNPVGSYSREWQRFCDWDAASGNSLVASRTKLNEAIPYFSLNRLRGFAGYLLEWYGRANLLSYQSAINFYYQNHGYAKPWTGGRCRRLCNAYTTAREARARANGEKGGGLREEICETAVQWMLSNADSQTDPIRRGRMLVVLIMILGFFRANTIGALESEDDIAFDQLGNLRIIIRALKGHKLAAPNIMTIVAVPEHTNRSRASEGRPLHARTQLFESIRKAKAEGIALNLCRSASSAHDQITDWFSPADGK